MSSPQLASSPTGDSDRKREGVLRVMSAAAFNHILPGLSCCPAHSGALDRVPRVYRFPGYARSCVHAALWHFDAVLWTDLRSVGRKPVILSLMALTVVTTAGAATAHTASQMMIWRLLGGIASGGIVPIALALLADLVPYEQRGRPIGWMFGAIAGGVAFGSSLGALLNPIIGWRAEFLITAGFSAAVLAFAIRLREFLGGGVATQLLSPAMVIRGYWSLVVHSRGTKAYAYILLNGMFHSGVFTWLGLYFSQRYQLNDEGIGVALLGYGVPGTLLGPVIGRLADRAGRKRIIPLGILIGALSAAALVPLAPLLWPAVIIGDSLFGFRHEPSAIGWNNFFAQSFPAGPGNGHERLFVVLRFRLGPLAFELLLKHEFSTALAVFACVELCLAILAVWLFRGEDFSAGDHSRKNPP